MSESSTNIDAESEGDAPDVSDLIVELLERTEDGAASQSVVLDQLCRSWPSRAAALRVAAGNLDAAGWIDLQPLPESIGDFTPISRLGGGGMGVVLLAEQPGLDRKVAIKLLRTDELLREGARARFQRETEAVARLAHPNIVAVHSVGLDNGIPFLVMDYVEGASLDRIIAAQRGRAPDALSGGDLQTAIAAELAGLGVATDSPESGTFDGTWIDVAIRVTRDVASALAHAHARDVLHRDVKPSNVMLTIDGRVQLVDFGLATMLDAERLTRSGSLVGSLPYMAPEELSAGSEPTASGDIYALGVTLYELLILDLPFPGRGTGRLRKDIEDGHFVRANSLNRAISADLEAVLSKACSRQPEDRYASASAFAADLTALLEKRPVAARLPSTWSRLKSWARRRPEQAVLACVVGLVAIGAPTVYGYLRSAHADEMVEINEKLTLALDEESEARAEADRNFAQLEIALADEGKARAAADQHFLRALDALDRVTNHMARAGLEDEPRMQRERLVIIDDALEILDELREERPDHPFLLDTWAGFLVARGEVLLALGNADEGLEALERTAAVRQQLAATRPDNLRLAYRQAVAELKVAWGLSHHGRQRESVEIYRAAIRRVEAYLAAVPDNVEVMNMLGDGRSSYAAALFALDRIDECSAAIDAALPLAQSTAADNPLNDVAHSVLAKLAHTHGLVFVTQGGDTDAEAEFRRSADSLNTALSIKPGRRSYQSRIVSAEIKRAECLSRLDRPEDALECLARAFEGNDELRRRFPSVASYRKRHSTLLSAAAFAEASAKNFVRAVELGEQALQAKLDEFEARGQDLTKIEGLNLGITMINLSARIQECAELGDARFERAKGHALKALELIAVHDPELGMARTVVQFANYCLVLSAAGLDDLMGAKQAIKTMVKVTKESPRELHLLTGAWSQVVGVRTRMNAPQNSIDAASDAAIRALEGAIAAGFTSHASLVDDPFLDPLRADERFQALVEELAGR